MKELRLRARATASQAKPVENVLREGLRLERVPGPVDPRAVRRRPATWPIARSSRRSTSCGGPTCCRTSSCSLAIGRRPYDDESFRRRDPGLARPVQPGPAGRSRRPGDRSPSGSATSTSTSPTRRASTRLATRLDDIDAERGTRGQPALLPGHAAVAVRRDRRPARARRARPRAPRGRLAAGRHREAVRARPRLRQAAQPRGRQGLPRVAGLPHRPLPGQGDRPQPAGLPVRERHLRAALEPPLRRPRADHRGRVDRDREPRRLLRGDRRVARRPPEPPAPAGQPRGDGAAGDVRGGRPARREGQGPAGDLERSARPRRPTSSAASTGRAGSRPPRSPATARNRTSTASRRPRRSWRRD